MFTGLIEEVGTLRDVRRSTAGAAMRVECALSDLALGESVAVDGACLTVTRLRPDGFDCDASAETLSCTTLDDASTGRRVHLERALRLGKRLGGHLVSGHVDGVGHLVARRAEGDAARVTFEVPDRLAPFVASKGSVCIDGVSLTVNEVDGSRFGVVLVPFTLNETTFVERPVGARVNVEVDVLAKYVARLLGRPGVDARGRGDEEPLLDLLGRQGYL